MDLTLKAGTEDQNYSCNNSKTLLFFSTVLALTLTLQKELWVKLLVPVHKLRQWKPRVMIFTHWILPYTLSPLMLTLACLLCHNTGRTDSSSAVHWTKNGDGFKGKTLCNCLNFELSFAREHFLFERTMMVTNYSYLELGILYTSSWRLIWPFKENNRQYFYRSVKKKREPSRGNLGFCYHCVTLFSTVN